MYQEILYIHSAIRWLVLASLFYAIFRAYKGYVSNSQFSEVDNAVRHWTATIAHIQLLLGMILYFQSPVVKIFRDGIAAGKHFDVTFFGIIHSVFMLIAIVVVTIGSSIAKRALNDKDKFKTMLFWFLIALFIIFIAIPWPFSPLSNRPYLR